MNIQVTKPFAADLLPPREPTLPELIVEAWKADRYFSELTALPQSGVTDAEYLRADEAAFEARQALLNHLLNIGVTRDLARKLGELV